MTTNQKIRNAAYRMARGEIPPPGQAKRCLQAVRLVIEHALWDAEYRLYDTWLPVGTSMRTGDDIGQHRADPWASDLEASMKHLGFHIPSASRAPGDLIFDYRRLKPWGHVGVLLEAGLVLESTDVRNRRMSVHLTPFLCLTPVEHFPHTLVARLPQEGL